MNIINPEDAIAPRPLIVVIYGRPGVGKSTLAFTAQNPFMFDFDRGLARTVKRKKAAQPDTWQDVLDYLQEGRLAEHRGGTLIIDTAKTMLDDFIGAHLLREPRNRKKGGGLSQIGFGAMKEEFAAFIRQTREYELDLIFIAHAQLKEEGETKIFVPMMTGGSFDTLVNKADLIGFMETKNNRTVLNFAPTDRHIGKNSAELAPITIPHYTLRDFETLMGDILDDARARMTQRTLEQDQAIRQSEALRLAIDQAGTVERLNELLPELADLPATYREPVAGDLYSRYEQVFQERSLNPIALPEAGAVAPTEAIEALTALVESVNTLPEKAGPFSVRLNCKRMLNEHAKRLGLEWSRAEKQFVSALKKAAV